jgi:hypothetical protein
MKRLLVLTFLASFAGSGILAYSSNSAAYLRLSSATACAVNTLTGGITLPTYSQEGIRSQSFAGLEVFCPYIEHSGSLKQDVRTIWIDVFDGSTETPGWDGFIFAKACSQPYGGGAMTCGGGPTTDGAGTGNTSLLLSGANVTDAWGPAHSDDYATLYVRLGKSSKLYGFATN